LLEKDSSNNDWIGALPFLSAGLGYLSYRNANPVTAIRDMMSAFVAALTTEQPSTSRGWIYGIVTLSIGGAVLDATFGAARPGSDHEWTMWLAIGMAVLVGIAGARQPNPLKVLGSSITLLIRLTLFLLLAALALGVILLGYTAVSSYGILGVIAILLALVVYKLDQLVRKR